MSTREKVDELLAEGWTITAIASALGISKPTVCFHARRLGYPAQTRFARRFDWQAIQRYYDEGHSVRECVARFGFHTAAWHEAVKRGAVIPRPQALPIETFLVQGRRTNRHHLKSRLLKAGLKDPRCEECGLSEWRGRPLSLELHHRNGVRDDNRLQNLAILCPNCHCLTHSWGGRNRRGPGAAKPA